MSFIIGCCSGLQWPSRGRTGGLIEREVGLFKTLPKTTIDIMKTELFKSADFKANLLM